MSTNCEHAHVLSALIIYHIFSLQKLYEVIVPISSMKLCAHTCAYFIDEEVTD